MALSMYAASVPVFLQFLTALSDVIGKASVHAKVHNIEESFLLQMRLYPDMYSLVLQVQQCCSHAARICGMLAGMPPLNLPKEEKTFAELQASIAATMAYLKTLPARQFEGTDEQIFDFNGRLLSGRILLLHRVLPHFYFHCTTAYDILRHCGVPLVKHDFLGVPQELMHDPAGLRNWSFSR
jgi:hypothetical protein